MTKRRPTTLPLFLLTATVLATAALAVAQQPDRADLAIAEVSGATSFAPHGPCKIAGSWQVTSPAFRPDLGDHVLLGIATITPLDPTCRRFAYSLVPVNPELTFGGIYPEAATPPGLFGSMVRSAHGYTLYATAPSPGIPHATLPIRAPVLYFWTYSAAVVCTDERCSSMAVDGVVSLFSSIDDPNRDIPPLGIFGINDQDRDDDGFADPGEQPLLQAPFPFAGKRIAPPMN